jgi:hypothetical protein
LTSSPTSQATSSAFARQAGKEGDSYCGDLKSKPLTSVGSCFTA